MKKVIRLTERDLTRVVKQIIKEYGAYEKSLDDLENDYQERRMNYHDSGRGKIHRMYTGEDNYSDYEDRKDNEHNEKMDTLKTFYKEKIMYDFLQNPNFTSEENDRMEDMEEKLTNPNLGKDKIQRFKSIKRDIYLRALDRYLRTLDRKYTGENFIYRSYDYFKNKIDDFLNNGVSPSEPIAPTYPNLIQRATNKVKGYFGLSEDKRLTERDLTRIVKRVINESKKEPFRSAILKMSKDELKDVYGELEVKGEYHGNKGTFHHFKRTAIGDVVCSFRTDDTTPSGLKRNTQSIKVKSPSVKFD